MIGEFLKVGRSYIFYYDEGAKTVSNRYEWCAPGVKPQLDYLQDVPVVSFPYFFKCLFEDKKPLMIQDVERLGEEAEAEKQTFFEQEIKSILAVPMLYQDKIFGFMGFDAVFEKMNWSEEMIALLQVTSNLIILVEAKSKLL